MLMVGCSEKGKDTAGSREPQASDTLYTWRAAMKVYGYQPERALQIIDSAVVVGNMSEVWADANKARIYSMTQMNEQMDSLLGGAKGAGLHPCICFWLSSPCLRLWWLYWCGVSCTISANCTTKTMSLSAKFVRTPNCVTSYAMPGEEKMLKQTNKTINV